MIIDARAISDEHFELLGGTHSDTFIRFSRIADDDARLQLLADWFLPAVAAWLPTVIVAPSTAGVALGATIARRLAVPFDLAEVVERLIHAHPSSLSPTLSCRRGRSTHARCVSSRAADTSGGSQLTPRRPWSSRSLGDRGGVLMAAPPPYPVRLECVVPGEYGA
ncbi:MAG: hypothetical protein ABIR67_00410 [Gaiellaceae bacterium]